MFSYPSAEHLPEVDIAPGERFADQPVGALHEAVGEWCQAMSRLQAMGSELLAAWDAQAGWGLDGAVNGAQWLRSFGDLDSPGGRIKVARRLRDAPLTSAALAAGELSYEKAAILMRAVSDGLMDAYLECEQVLVDTAKELPLRQVTTLARRWRSAALDTVDFDDRESELYQSRSAHIYETLDGMLAIEVLLPADEGAAVRAALEEQVQKLFRDDIHEARALAGLEPPDKDDDELTTEGLNVGRSTTQRRADAFVDLILGGADTGGTNERVGGPAAALHLSTDIETILEAAVRRANASSLVLPWLDAPGGDAARGAAGDPDRDPREFARELLDHLGPLAQPDQRAALQAAAERALDPDRVPTLDGHDHPVDLTLVDLLACDCTLNRVVLDAAGVPIDLGRTQRVASREQRRALRKRDGGCAFPGCDRPPEWCDAHHILAWILLGPTDLDNLVFLCRRHHRLMHQKVPWTVHIDPTTRRPVFHRPDGRPARAPGLRPYQRGRPPDPPPDRFVPAA